MILGVYEAAVTYEPEYKPENQRLVFVIYPAPFHKPQDNVNSNFLPDKGVKPIGRELSFATRSAHDQNG